MEDSEILQELLSLLESNGIAIRAEHIAGGGGGLCSVKHERIFFVDKDISVGESIEIAAKAVRQLVDIEAVYLRPQIRAVIEEEGD